MIALATLAATLSSGPLQRFLKTLGSPKWIEDFRCTVREQIKTLRVAAGTLDVEAVRDVENPTP